MSDRCPLGYLLHIASRGIILSKQQTIKMLIRLQGCAGWSAPLLFAYGINRFSHDVAQIWETSFESCFDYIKFLRSCFKHPYFLEYPTFTPVICKLQFKQVLRLCIFIALLWKSGGYTGFSLSFRHSVIPSFRNLSNVNFSSHFSQELWCLEDWNLVHMWTVGRCIVYTGIRLLLLIRPLGFCIFVFWIYWTRLWLIINEIL